MKVRLKRFNLNGHTITWDSVSNCSKVYFLNVHHVLECNFVACTIFFVVP